MRMASSCPFLLSVKIFASHIPRYKRHLDSRNGMGAGSNAYEFMDHPGAGQRAPGTGHSGEAGMTPALRDQSTAWRGEGSCLRPWAGRPVDVRLKIDRPAGFFPGGLCRSAASAQPPLWERPRSRGLLLICRGALQSLPSRANETARPGSSWRQTTFRPAPITRGVTRSLPHASRSQADIRRVVVLARGCKPD